MKTKIGIVMKNKVLKRSLPIFSIAFCLMSVSSCVKTKTNTSKKTETNTQQTQNTFNDNITFPPSDDSGNTDRDNPDSGSDSGSEPGHTGDTGTGGPGEGFTPYQACVADAGQTINCYHIDNIVFHGTSNGSVVWSSETDLDGYNPFIFDTNSRFNLEVIPRYQNKGVDSRGNECKYIAQPFGKLQVGVRVRSTESGTSDYFLFDNVAVDKASYVHEFTPPSNSSTPLVIDILNVKWDWSCQDYENQGFPNQQGVCPWDNVWNTECIKLEVRFSTDTTKDLPGPRR